MRCFRLNALHYVWLLQRLAGHPCDFGRPVAAGIIIENLAGDRAFVCWVESVDV
jgi:hypothetical protein